MKELIFLAGTLVAVPIGAVMASMFQRVRDAIFVALVVGTTRTDLLHINFLSREWYRGTTRGIEISFLDLLVLILVLSTFLARRRRQPRLFWPVGLGFMLAYFAYACINVLAADPRLFGVFEVTKVFRGIAVFVTIAHFIEGRREIRLLLFALCGAMGYEALVALQQRYLLHGYRIAGTLDHANTLSMYCCIVAPILIAAAFSDSSVIERGLFAFCALLAFGCAILSVSRMGFLTFAIAAGCTVIACLDFRRMASSLLILALLGIAAAGMSLKAWNTLSSRYGERSIEDEYGEDANGRGVYFRLAGAIARDHFFGVGINNWSYWVTQEYASQLGLVYRPYIGTDEMPDQTVPEGSKTDGAQAAPAHNLGALTLGELGWPGVILFGAVWLRCLQVGAVFLRKREAALLSRFGTGAFFALVATLLQSMTEWAYRQTPLFFLVNIIVGALAALYFQRDASRRLPVRFKREMRPRPPV